MRSFAQADFGYVVRRWHETNLASYPYSPEHQRHSLHDASVYFRDRVLPECDVWIAEAGAAAAGLMAIAPPWIRHLAVFPEHQRGGIGTALLRRARELSPQELRLSTFQRNLPARAFYEHHRFVAFGSSPPPENEPDVEYRWTA
ncbi:MAG TPA: GNAT family N-acetyltransferase [Casimicrobiaceae bacterium]|nr:GNAT family N-acetyltransferase [Casimicrobiaceae bacterium]